MSKFYSENRGLAPLIIIIASAVVLVTIPVAIYLVSQRQEIRKKAAGEQQLICDPPVNTKYNSNQIIVTNNLSSRIKLEIQENLCDYSEILKEKNITHPLPGGELPDGTKCDLFSNKYQQEIDPGVTHTFSMNVPNCKVGQLDVYTYPITSYNEPNECYTLKFRPAPGGYWDTGIAFTLKANPTNYDPVTKTCPQATVPPTATTTPTITPTGTRTPTTTPTRTPTVPPGATNTPIPTNTPVPTSPPGSTPTNTPPPPVSGGIAPTVITLIGGGLLILIGLLL